MRELNGAGASDGMPAAQKPDEQWGGPRLGEASRLAPLRRRGRYTGQAGAPSLAATVAPGDGRRVASADWSDEASRFRTLADSIDQGFCVIEVILDSAGGAIDYRFLEVNRVFRSQTGLHDAVGKRMLELAPKHERFWIDTYTRVAETGEAIRFEHEAEALGRWFDVFAFRVGHADERKVAILFKDISDRVRVTTALAMAERRKNEFMSILAHELRNPLSPMLSALEVARSTRDAVEREKALGILQRQVESMRKLVSDLDDTGRIARGTVELDLVDCDLLDVVHRAIEIANPSIASRSQWLDQELAAGPLAIQADLFRLTQAVSNVLLNASKFTPAGGRLTIRLCREADAAVVEVADNGMGIARERLADIFELFSQVDSMRQHAHEGLGIGLAVAKSIAHLHGGWIEARSDGPGRGSLFRMGVPLRTRSP